jgi:hypothetical protein
MYLPIMYQSITKLWQIHSAHHVQMRPDQGPVDLPQAGRHLLQTYFSRLRLPISGQGVHLLVGDGADPFAVLSVYQPEVVPVCDGVVVREALGVGLPGL